jgi:hypothetical protein
MSNAQVGEQYGQALRQYLAAQGDLLQALIKLGGESEVTKFVNALQRFRVLNEQIAVDGRQFNLVRNTVKANTTRPRTPSTTSGSSNAVSGRG